MDNTINTLEVPAAEKKDKGFTLVELLIVIVILGILATVTVFAVRGITDKGKTSACKADQKSLEVAVEAFIANGGSVADADEANLVPGFLKSQVAGYNVTDGVISVETGAANTNGCVLNP